MNDATPWVDPELVAAGQLLQSRGFVVPDRTKAPLSEVRAAQDRVGAFLGEGSVPLKARARPDLARAARTGAVPTLSARRCVTPAADCLRPWRRLYAGQPGLLGRDAARVGAAIGGSGVVGRLQALARAPFSQGVRGDGRSDPARGARGLRSRHRSGSAGAWRRFGRRQSGAGRSDGVARRGSSRAALYAADLRRLLEPTARARRGSALARVQACRRPRCGGSGRPISKSRNSSRIGAPLRFWAILRAYRRPI